MPLSTALASSSGGGSRPSIDCDYRHSVMPWDRWLGTGHHGSLDAMGRGERRWKATLAESVA